VAERAPATAREGFVLYAAVPLIASLPGALTARIISRQRELAADRAAATLTGSPSGVAAALMHVSRGLRQIPIWDLRAAAARDLFNFVPARHAELRGLARLWATHPPIERRLAQLDRMEQRLQRARTFVV
jgi:heat shock protein HtpX